MKITRTQSGRKVALGVSLGFVLNEITSAHCSNIVRSMRRDGLTVNMITRHGIRVSYTFPMALMYLMGPIDKIGNNNPLTRMGQMRALAFFAGVHNLTEEYVAGVGVDRVIQALLSHIDKVLGHEDTLSFNEMMA